MYQRSGIKSSGIVLMFTGLVMTVMLLSAGGCGNSEARMSLAEVRSSIQQVLAIHSAEYRYRDVVYFGESTRLFGFIPAGDREILFSVHVLVRAGVRLEEGFSLERLPGGQLLIRLPEPEILYVDVDEQSIHQYFVREQGSSIRWMEVQDVLARAKEQLSADAVARGILSQARTGAERVVLRLLEGMNVRVEFGPTGASNG